MQTPLLTAQHVDLRRASTAATTQGLDYTTHGTGSVGHRVNGHLGHLSRPGHPVAILTRCETLDFPVFAKNAQYAKRTFEMQK